MAEVTPAEIEQKADAAFATGFGDTPPAPAAKVIEQTPAEPAKPAAAPAAVAPAPKPEKPQYARVLQQDWDNLKAAAGKVANLESQITKLAGNTPDAERIAQTVIEKVRAQTPAGLNVEFSDEDFVELTENFPEVSTFTRAALERLFKKANVKGTGEPEPAKPETLDVNAAVEKALLDREATALAEAYPDWDVIVGRPPTADSQPVETPWRTWLATQPAEYQKKIGETKSPAVVQASIDKFKATQITPVAPAEPTRAAARRAVIADAVTPRADGNPPPLNAPESAEDAFGKAFKEAKLH